MHICPYRAMAIFILNKISLLEPKAPNRVRSAKKLVDLTNDEMKDMFENQLWEDTLRDRGF